MALITERGSASFVLNESAPRWKYDVFLSFRGVDTRKGFVSHLHHELSKCQGITTFMDDQELEGGTSIHLELPSAIEESHIAIVVLSPNYASSKWCLDELTTILKYMEARKSVLPVFYQTDQSDVGNQWGCFAKAFAEHEEKFITTEDKKKVNQWRADLKKVSKISGWCLKDFKCERELIEDIVKCVRRKVQATFMPLDSSQKLVGIDYSLEHLSLLLRHDANDVRFIGITGVGGIGKTTLAKLVYDKIRHHFDVHSFLANVREVCAEKGIVDFAKKLLFPFLRERITEIWDEECLSFLIRKILHNKKVLLVLDDVDELKQLEVLAGNQGWFGMGSRIIVTTRNQRLLVQHGIELSYKVQGLNDAEALELFSLHAFKKDQPEDDFLAMSRNFSYLARGLPLALKTFGSTLFKRGLAAWKSEWDSLSKIPNPTIFDGLKISYDGLDELEKSIFLDVACLHNGKYTKRVIEILDDSFGISSSFMIDALIERSLLYQDHQKCIWTHGLIRKMAWTIIHHRLTEPGQHNRLWLSKDICPLCLKNTGTGAIEAISLRGPKVEDVREWNWEAFSKMHGLRFLEFDNLTFSSGSKFLPRSLRIINWSFYPSNFLPASFQLPLLTQLQMHNSNLDRLWEGKMVVEAKYIMKIIGVVQDLPNLKCIDLSFSNKLMGTPNLSGIPNLVELNLQYCRNLVEIHPSIVVLKKLKVLNLRGCESIKGLLSEVEVDSLEYFSPWGCSNVKKIPEVGEQMKNVINLEGTTIEKIPSSIGHLVGLKDISSKDNCKYDVFLSFGGEDTRRTFTDHLYCTLTDHQFNVFMYGDVYDYKIEKSNGTVPEYLIQAIERSKVAVVVFSRGYPESVWCLEELVKIMDCTKTLDQIFFPIFYDVDPSNVQNQTGSFTQAFQKYEQEVEGEKVHLWRNALKEAGLLTGLNFRETDRNEGNFIRDVIAQITKKLISTTCLKVPTTTSLVGKDYRVREISKHLDVGGSNDVRIIGILGMCGLGKTTVAKAVFSKHHHSFDGASFLENVREKKLVDLQEQLLSDILKLAYIVVSSIDEGTKEIEQRLGNRKVLVVIDDLDSVEQLDALAIKPDSFGPGSRIIITSRNEHLLKILNVDKICPLLAMNEREALQLLSWHAFGKNYPKEEYVELSRKAVGYCGGLPLALEVLGSYLCTKSTSEWETVLDEWKISQPYWEIHRTLETSYDGLIDDDVKAIFLDISCFFTGMNKDHVMTVLDGCQFYPEIGIQELQDQCLVTVGKEGNLMMHDLIQGMGREIVRAESPDNPGKRSRLWHNEDITGVLMEQSGTEDVEGLALDMQASDKLSFSSESFKNMQSLRLLKLNNIKLNGSYHNLSKELRWLCWHGFPREFLPKDFDQPNLVAIDLSYSKLIQVWEDSDLLLEKLKLLNLSHSHNLAQTPDFSNLPNLEELILNNCESLSEVHSSIGNLERLALVNLEGCKNLKDLPLNFFNSKSIETLLLKGCSRFENLAEGLGKSYHKTADGIPIRQILKLRFSSQHDVKESPSTSLLPPSLHAFNSLRKLDLGCCTLTDDEIPKDLGSLISLEDLDLRESSFCSLPSLSGLSKLETLCLDDCTNLHAIPNLPTNLKVLRAGLCTALETMPDFSELSNMRELYLSHSCKLTEITGLGMSLNSMTKIHMEGCVNLTDDFRKNILQGWTSCGYGGIFLSGNYIPDWYEIVNHADRVSFDIPPTDYNFSGLTVFCFYSSYKQSGGPLSIIVSNQTKRTAFLARITDASVPTSLTSNHYLWQGQISNDVLSLQAGDKVSVSVETADASVTVKRIGVNQVWDKFMKENMHDSDCHLYEFDPHPDWF